MPVTLEELRTRVQPWLEPVSPEAPAGKSAKLEPAYERLAAEVAKLESPNGGKIDWEQVVANGQQILRTTSKDLLIVCYIAYGQLVTQGLGGFAEGLSTLTQLMEQYWPALFPEQARMRARVNALSWLLERSRLALTGRIIAASERDGVEGLEEVARRLSEVGREKFGSQVPAFGPLLSALEQLRRSLPEPQAPATEAPPAPTAAPAGPAGATDPAEAGNFLWDVGNSLISTAHLLRRANTTDPAAYRVLRIGLWLHLQQPPGGGSNGRIPIPPVPPSRRSQLEQMAQHGKW